MKAAEAKEETENILGLKVGSGRLQLMYRDILIAANNGKYSVEVEGLAAHDVKYLEDILGYKVVTKQYRFDGLTYNKYEISWE